MKFMKELKKLRKVKIEIKNDYNCRTEYKKIDKLKSMKLH